MAPRPSSSEFDPGDTAREVPEDLETKSTIGTLIGYRPSPQPHASRTGSSLTATEREDAQVFPGTFAAGNGVQNDDALSTPSGGANGLATDSGGTQTSSAPKTTAKTTAK